MLANLSMKENQQIVKDKYGLDCNGMNKEEENIMEQSKITNILVVLKIKVLQSNSKKYNLDISWKQLYLKDISEWKKCIMLKISMKVLRLIKKNLNMKVKNRRIKNVNKW